MSPLFWIPLSAFLASLALHAWALRLFPKIGLLDFPERYGLQRSRIPYPVGIVSVLLFVAFFLAISPWSLKTASIVLAVLILGIFTFRDDRNPLPPLLRLAVHVCIALLIFLGGARIFSFTNPLAGIFGSSPVLVLNAWIVHIPFFGTLPLLSGLFTVFWLCLTINALNWFDGIPGQVSTLSVIGFLTIGFLSLSARVNQPHLALIAFVLAGIALGCLVFDLRPQTMLIGDTGAMFFGLMLGILTIYSGGKVATAFLVLGVPLIDFLLVIGRRIVKRKNPAKGNAKDEHLHHRLLAKGWSREAVILLTAGIGTAFGISALFLNTFEKFLAAAVLFLIMLSLSTYSRPDRQPDNQ